MPYVGRVLGANFANFALINLRRRGPTVFAESPTALEPQTRGGGNFCIKSLPITGSLSREIGMLYRARELGYESKYLLGMEIKKEKKKKNNRPLVN